MDINERLPELDAGQFSSIRKLVYRQCGIDLQPGKRALVRGRLVKRLRHLGLGSFEDYMELVRRNGAAGELKAMIDILTTNKTSFFREPEHFNHLRTCILPGMKLSRSVLRFWSAGCSTGEEPYSLAILLREEMTDIDSRDCGILATDISGRVLSRAREGTYDARSLRDVPPPLLRRHFTRIQAQPEPLYRIGDKVRAMVRFVSLNLMGAWPMRGPFDAIFCRNVMIYFDRPTQRALARRFSGLLKPGGYLFIGHSESLANSFQGLRFVQPAIYVKEKAKEYPHGGL